MNGTIYMGNDSLLTVDGINSVILRLFNEIVRTIECCYVPQMKRNLISLLTLDSQNYRYYTENSVLKVYFLYDIPKRHIGTVIKIKAIQFQEKLL